MRARLLILPLALTLQACGASSKLAGETAPVAILGSALAAPDPRLTAPCEQAADLQGNALSAGGVQRLWAADRKHLADCRARHGAVVGFYRARDAALAGKR